MNIRLSFCIPTLNRASFISECLDSILSQANEEIEIVIVDGGSVDNTAEIVRCYQKSFAAITYFRRDVKMGVDRDILKTVELARGEYCWLMSDDDRVESEAVRHVVNHLSAHEGLAGASVNYVSYDQHLEYTIHTAPASIGGHLTGDYLFRSCEMCFSSLGIHLGYLPAQIIKRDVWGAIVDECDLTPYMDSYWLLVYIIGKMLERNPNWLYIHKVCLGNRSANDSFVSRVGVYNRQLITHVSFPRIIGDLFGKKSPVYDNVIKGLIAERMPKNLAKVKADGASVALQLKLFALYTRQYWYFPVYWWRVVPIFLIPGMVLKFVRIIYLRMKSRHGRQRVSLLRFV